MTQNDTSTRILFTESIVTKTSPEIDKLIREADDTFLWAGPIKNDTDDKAHLGIIARVYEQDSPLFWGEILSGVIEVTLRAIEQRQTKEAADECLGAFFVRLAARFRDMETMETKGVDE